MLKIVQTSAIKPPRLKPGATIGIVAPASPFNTEFFEQGVTVLETMGYHVRLADGLFAAQGYLAGPDTQRATQIHAMFQDDSVDAVMCARGGFGCTHLLPLLDFELIRLNPKPFIGFSDITILHQAFFLRTGLVTFHGPLVCTLRNSDEVSRDSWQQALTHDQPLCFQTQASQSIRSGRAEGMLVGGNLSNLCHLVGTPFSVNYRDCILFIEDTGEALYRIDRMLTQMWMAGCLDGVVGVVLGNFENCGSEEGLRDLIGAQFKNIPIAAGLMAGHGEPNLTLPLGLPALLDANAGRLTLLECATA
ncbi:MAG: LD-carboxypeptidase [Desulfobacteraceae bacterium]|nr:LD-carboxypeptidase [Desulfobacteraceae bacterium]